MLILAAVLFGDKADSWRSIWRRATLFLRPLRLRKRIERFGGVANFVKASAISSRAAVPDALSKRAVEDLIARQLRIPAEMIPVR